MKYIMMMTLSLTLSFASGFTLSGFSDKGFKLAKEVHVNFKTYIDNHKKELASGRIIIKGYADKSEGTDEFTYALGLKRAVYIKRGLEHFGIDVSRVTIISLARSTPICKEDTKECREKNKRVEIKLIP